MSSDTPLGRFLSRRDLLRWLSASASASLASCSGGPSGPDDTGGGGGGTGTLTLHPGQSVAGKGTPGTPVSPAQQVQAFAALETKLNELLDPATGLAPADQVLGWLAQQDAYATVGYSATRDVYAIFTNGHPHLIQTDSRMGTTGVAPLPGPGLAVTRETPATARAVPGDYDAGLPAKQFRFINTWYDEGEDFGPIPTWCDGDRTSPRDPGVAADAMERFGYEIVFGQAGKVSSGTSGDLENLKLVTGDGVFYWGTHGGTIDPAGNVTQALMTSTLADESTIPDYTDEIEQHTLIYYTAPLCPAGCGSFMNPRGFRTRFAITPIWITKYQWSFGQHSLVFVNACMSGTSNWKQAFLGAGASVYLGWNLPVRFWAVCGSALDFFSLMLGLNENNGGPGGAVIYPRQRPYDWGEVLYHLQASSWMAGYDDPTEGFVMLEATVNQAVPLLFLCLRPSMYWNVFDELTGEHHLIGGMFGANPGTAAMGTSVDCGSCSGWGAWADDRLTGAVPLAVKSWSSLDVVLDIPASGPGSAGIVQVAVDGRFSNGAQLTRVSFPLLATQNHGGTLEVRVDAQLRFRGDYRGVRLKPIEPLTFVPTTPVYTPTLTGTFTATGSYTYSDPANTIHVAWSGSGAVTPTSQVGLLYGDMVPKDRIGRFSVQIEGSGIHEKVTVTPQNGDPPYEYEQEIGFSIESLQAQGVPPQPHTILVPFDAAYASPQVTQSFTDPGASAYNSADVATSIQCGPFTSEFPPNEEMGGR